jgi:hypothetical protein
MQPHYTAKEFTHERTQFHYKVYELWEEPSCTIGSSGDIAFYNGDYYIRYENEWCASILDVDSKHRPKQRHPVLKSSRRFHHQSATWKSITHWNVSTVQTRIMSHLGSLEKSSLTHDALVDPGKRKLEVEDPKGAIISKKLKLYGSTGKGAADENGKYKKTAATFSKVSTTMKSTPLIVVQIQYRFRLQSL